MGTATRVPQTRTMDGDELEVDEAWTALRRYGGRKLLMDSFTRFRYADGYSHSRALALQIVLSAVPFGIAVVGLAGNLGQRKVGVVISSTLHQLSPATGQDVIDRTLDQAAGTGGKLALWLGLLFALVNLSMAMGQIERGANRIYGVERDRPTHRKYGVSTLLALTAGLPLAGGFLLLVAGSAAGDALAVAYGWGDTGHLWWDVLRWPIGILLVVGAGSVIFRRAPRRTQPGYTWLAVGSGVALLLWVLFTLLLVLYVARSDNFGSTYGPLTAIMALLLWAELTSIALFLGLAFAAQLEAARARVREPVKRDPGP